MSNGARLEVKTTASGVEVAVDDWEVFDYLDDLFTECDIAFDTMREDDSGNCRMYVAVFGPEVSHARVEEALKRIPPGELDRIWRLNN